MNTVRSSLFGWGSFSVAVLGGMYAANEWRQDRANVQVARGSKDMRVMTMEERIAKAEWEDDQAKLVAAGRMDQVHPLYVEMEQAKKATQKKVGHTEYDAHTA
eukprot:m.106667 g.106667  ORF g.106667 m.106667 type:complete len:103 (+) comp21103_c0_seq5:697-1005(+)